MKLIQTFTVALLLMGCFSFTALASDGEVNMPGRSSAPLATVCRDGEVNMPGVICTPPQSASDSGIITSLLNLLGF